MEGQTQTLSFTKEEMQLDLPEIRKTLPSGWSLESSNPCVSITMGMTKISKASLA